MEQKINNKQNRLRAVNLLEVQKQYKYNRDLKPLSAIIYSELLQGEGLVR